MSKQSIHASDEAWEDRLLGSDEKFVKVAGASLEASIDEASGTQLISIRLQKSLIEDFKTIASLNGGIGYQTLMKQIMQRFVDSEKNRIFNELVSERLKTRQGTKAVASPVKRKISADKQRKAA